MYVWTWTLNILFANMHNAYNYKYNINSEYDVNFIGSNY